MIKTKTTEELESRAADAARRLKSEPIEFRTDIRTDEAAVAFRGSSFEMPPEMAREFAEWLGGHTKSDPLGHEDREVYVTPIPGHYGLAGYCITINGSPCRGAAVVMFGDAGPSVHITRRFDKWVVGNEHNSAVGRDRLHEAIDFLKRMDLPAKANVRIPVPKTPESE